MLLDMLFLFGVFPAVCLGFVVLVSLFVIWLVGFETIKILERRFFDGEEILSSVKEGLSRDCLCLLVSRYKLFNSSDSRTSFLN